MNRREFLAGAALSSLSASAQPAPFVPPEFPFTSRVTMLEQLVHGYPPPPQMRIGFPIGGMRVQARNLQDNKWGAELIHFQASPNAAISVAYSEEEEDWPGYVQQRSLLTTLNTFGAQYGCFCFTGGLFPARWERDGRLFDPVLRNVQVRGTAFVGDSANPDFLRMFFAGARDVYGRPYPLGGEVQINNLVPNNPEARSLQLIPDGRGIGLTPNHPFFSYGPQILEDYNLLIPTLGVRGADHPIMTVQPLSQAWGATSRDYALRGYYATANKETGIPGAGKAQLVLTGLLRMPPVNPHSGTPDAETVRLIVLHGNGFTDPSADVVQFFVGGVDRLTRKTSYPEFAVDSKGYNPSYRTDIPMGTLRQMASGQHELLEPRLDFALGV